MTHADHLVPPAALRPRRGVVHAVRAFRARHRARVTVREGVMIGRRVQLEAAPGARIILEDGCVLGDGCRILVRDGRLQVGAGATLGERCMLVAHAGIVIGAGAVLGDRVTVVDFDHGIEDVERPIRLQPVAASAVTVGARARVGHGASLLRGTRVEPGSNVGAHVVMSPPDHPIGPE